MANGCYAPVFKIVLRSGGEQSIKVGKIGLERFLFPLKIILIWNPNGQYRPPW